MLPDLDEHRRRVREPEAYDVAGASTAHELGMIVHEAAGAIGTPMALISLLDRHRLSFRAKVGIKGSEAPLASSFCAQTVLASGVMAIADATRDARFANYVLVRGRPHVRFYAGVALQIGGRRIGTLCVLDDQSRLSISPLQECYLLHLADRAAVALTGTHGF